MDAAKFIEERNRMCKSFGDTCTKCPVFNDSEDTPYFCEFGTKSPMNAVDQVAIVEDWSDKHPRKTQQDVFLKQWPEAVRDAQGVINICPTTLCPTHINSNRLCSDSKATCADCRREFWMETVE